MIISTHLCLLCMPIPVIYYGYLQSTMATYSLLCLPVVYYGYIPIASLQCCILYTASYSTICAYLVQHHHNNLYAAQFALCTQLAYACPYGKPLWTKIQFLVIIYICISIVTSISLHLSLQLPIVQFNSPNSRSSFTSTLNTPIHSSKFLFNFHFNCQQSNSIVQTLVHLSL